MISLLYRVATPELYPTHTRATAHAIANSISHFGGFLVPYLIDSATIPATGVVLAIMNFVGMFSVFFLPETLGKACLPHDISAVLY